ncbi:MAG TPA: V-type ATPase 116kDa subunit family protein [Spirochaetota bacterium]|nr:V-type ATPase 116kDa subunit family protein [Spirochaetota bacterium]
MMFTRADIRKVSIAVTEKDYGTLVVRLGKSRLMHIDRETGDETTCAVNPEAVFSFSVNTIIADKIIAAAKEFHSETYSAPGDPENPDTVFDDIPSLLAGDFEADLHEAEIIKKKVKQYTDTRLVIGIEIKSLETKLAEIRQLRQSGIDLEQLRGLKNISYIYGRVSGNEWLNSVDKRIFYIKNGDYLLAVFPRDLKDNFLNNFKREGFEDLDGIIRRGNTLEDEESASVKRITELQRRIARIDTFYHEKLQYWRERMSYLEAVYSILLKISGAESKFLFSEDIVVISGWINLKDAEKLRIILEDVCGTRFYFKTGSRVESRRFRDRMPVILKNNLLFRPFELLVRMMGLPGNREIDPTPAAALAYVIIFGVMFGDTGQGLVLVLTGLMLNVYGKKKYRAGNNISDFGSIMTWCGFSAAAFGLLYGSFFSYEHFIPALLFHPMENMMQLLLMAIMMGTVFISLGLLLNIINGLLAGRYEDSLCGARGMPGLAIYGSCIFFAMRFILAGKVPGTQEIISALAFPAAVFCLRGPLEFIFFHGEHIFHNGLFEYIVETIIEIMEMFSGFLGNTISYIRAGAFALSHAGLSLAVFTLAGIVDPSMNSIGAILVIVTGNIFIILLEGLVCGIQSMRLEYYEFFGKFFKGDGVAFTPFSLGLKQVKDGGIE